MYSYALFGLLAVAQARFGQEQVPIPAIAALTAGPPGVAQTLAGSAVSDLLAATNACLKLQKADQIVQQLGTGADVVAAARGLVAAEKNFNPFVQSIPTICNDPTLPVTNELRGITPKIDPAVGGSAVANALSAQTVATPLDATGKSVADLLAANGFTNFTTQGLTGSTGAAPAGAGAASSAVSSATAVVASVPTSSVASVVAVATDQCAAQVAAALSSASAAVGTTASATAIAVSNNTVAATTAAASATISPAAGTNVTSSIAGADFGTCNPTIKFEGGLGGRPATEFTFQSQDPAIIAVQQEALNPNIITNAICNSLTNLNCGANAQAKTVCKSAQAQILALGTRDITTAQTWNSLVGFPGVSTNPDGGASVPPATATAAAGKRRRWTA